MNDTISRQAAIDAVCMEWCNVKHQDCKHPFDVEKDDYYWCDGCETALRTLPDLPSVQPEIIRCKDCKWYGRVDKRRFYRGMDCLQKHIDTIVPDRDFCSKAERRGEQDE